MTVKRLRRTGYNIGYARVYHILKSNDMVTSSPAKSRQRKWVRYERLYSNAMWHADWHAMKDPRMKGMNLITYLYDASRCVTGAALFREATSKNAVIMLRQTISRFGVPATILSDNGSCFVGVRDRKKPKNSWMPTLFENELLSLNIILINSRPYHP
ncbi:MAG: transposase family protein [Cenarchaeum sp. SB0663_bin_5]|nr:transposase family protein [Cenarchaeum sp. SB0663_bin_5]